MAKCMNQDARRRFVYGFTIEDCHMRIWFCDRTQILVSTEFDFISVRISYLSPIIVAHIS